MKLWPGAVVIFLDASSTAGVGGEVPELGRVPQLERLRGAVVDELLHRERRAETGQRTLPRYCGVSSTPAAARMPTVVGEMMPARFG